MEFCCEYLRLALEDPKTSIKYYSLVREFYLEAEQGLMINYCPSCGARLPKALRNEYFDILEQEYGIETDVGEALSRKDLPDEFRTDEWWKKRGL